MSVRPSALKKSSITGQLPYNFMFVYFSNNVENIQVSLQPGKNNLRTFLIIPHSVLPAMRKILDISCIEYRNRHFMLKHPLAFNRKSRRLWDNVEKILHSRTGHKLQYNKAHALRVLDT
jgi:hypothetical protein